MMTTFECIFRESTFGVAVKLEADESPAVGDMRWLCDAAAAMGTENKDRNRGEALLKVEANTLATCEGHAWKCGRRCRSMEGGIARGEGVVCGAQQVSYDKRSRCRRRGWKKVM